MKTACRALAVTLVIAPTGALAQTVPEPEDRHEITLDIDNDGKADRAVLIQKPASRNGDLYIYLDAGTGTLDPSRKPAIVKANLTDARINGFESKGQGKHKQSLVITYGCGGCSSDYETTLTIVHRGGRFLVAGYTYSWETRDGSGRCDVNFLTGKGTLSRKLGKSRPIKGAFAPVALADWSDVKRPKACLR